METAVKFRKLDDKTNPVFHGDPIKNGQTVIVDDETALRLEARGHEILPQEEYEKLKASEKTSEKNSGGK